MSPPTGSVLVVHVATPLLSAALAHRVVVPVVKATVPVGLAPVTGRQQRHTGQQRAAHREQPRAALVTPSAEAGRNGRDDVTSRRLTGLAPFEHGYGPLTAAPMPRHIALSAGTSAHTRVHLFLQHTAPHPAR